MVTYNIRRIKRPHPDVGMRELLGDRGASTGGQLNAPPGPPVPEKRKDPQPIPSYIPAQVLTFPTVVFPQVDDRTPAAELKSRLLSSTQPSTIRFVFTHRLKSVRFHAIARRHPLLHIHARQYPPPKGCKTIPGFPDAFKMRDRVTAQLLLRQPPDCTRDHEGQGSIDGSPSPSARLGKSAK